MVFYGNTDTGRAHQLGAHAVRDENGLLKRLEMIETGKVESMGTPKPAPLIVYNADFEHDTGNTRAALEH